MKRRILSLGLAALVTVGLFSSPDAFAQERVYTRGRRVTAADPVVLNRTELTRRLARLEAQLLALKPVRRVEHGSHGSHGSHSSRSPHVSRSARNAVDVPGRRASGEREDGGRSVGRGDVPIEIGRSRHGPVAPPVLNIAQLDEALRTLEGLRRHVERAPAYAPEPLPVAMADRSFALLARRVRRTSFSSEKSALVREVAKDAYFTSEQAYALVALIPFSDDQVEAAVVLYGSVLNREDFHRVYDALKFSSSRSALRRRLARLR